MKVYKRILVLVGSVLVLFAGLASCTVRTKTIKTNPNGIPPGQAKKMTGSQSASPYAPGHNK